MFSKMFSRSAVLILAFAVTFPHAAHAQTEIEIDTSVLHDLPVRPANPNTRRIVLTPPAEKDLASAEAVRPVKKPVETVPIVPAVKPQAVNDIPSSTPVPAIADNTVELEKFPIFTKTRSESTDPSLPESAPAPQPPQVAETIDLPSLSPSAPAERAVAPLPEPVAVAENPPASLAPPEQPKQLAMKDITEQKQEAPENANPEDKLLSDMMEMEKSQVMAGVEDTVRQTGDQTVAAVKEPDIKTTAQDLRPERDSDVANIEPATGAPQGMLDNQYSISIPYTPDQVSIDSDLQRQIMQKIMPMLSDNKKGRLQIQAFASDGDNNSHTSRQRSLARALAVREYLMSQGIDPARMDIRAMGKPAQDQKPDRVDFVLLSSGASSKL